MYSRTSNSSVVSSVAVAVNATRDGSSAVWVDAGDAVSCAFSPTFQTLGTHDVQVVVSYDDGSGVQQVTDGATLTAAVASCRVPFTNSWQVA